MEAIHDATMARALLSESACDSQQRRQNATTVRTASVCNAL